MTQIELDDRRDAIIANRQELNAMIVGILTGIAIPVTVCLISFYFSGSPLPGLYALIICGVATRMYLGETS